MTTEQTQTLLAMVVVLGMLALLVLPSLIGIVRDRRIDRQIEEAQEHDGAQGHEEEKDQKSSSRSTVPSTATWYADGRRSKKLVSS
ncbi:type II secretion system protein [Streptomyces antibioticus]|uniref:type II secretion system protein n=1 Tax=Streptomyces antibioticus TaxID=1890 RepID=UPI0022567E60|nr:type II secretion system protein [Streptomyces antibioticus]MCX4743180.1 type II secretion system GspH family protein [Streptomyces antibioticus]